MGIRSPEAADLERLLTEYTEALRDKGDAWDHVRRLEAARLRIVEPADALDADGLLVLMFTCAIDAGAAAEAKRVYDSLPQPLRQEIDLMDREKPRSVKIWRK